MANQRYFAVRLPSPRANLIGTRMKGIGYQIKIPMMLKKKWQSAICGRGGVLETNIRAACCIYIYLYVYKDARSNVAIQDIPANAK